QQTGQAGAEKGRPHHGTDALRLAARHRRLCIIVCDATVAVHGWAAVVAAAAGGGARLSTYAASSRTRVSPKASPCAGIWLSRPLVMVSRMVWKSPPCSQMSSVRSGA